jgi:hypothetical protein
MDCDPPRNRRLRHYRLCSNQFGDGERLRNEGRPQLFEAGGSTACAAGNPVYRLEISFRNKAGALLGRFGEYVRVLRRTGSEGRRLALNKTSFLPGEAVVAHAEELGVGWIEVNDTYTIEVHDGSTWARAPITPKGVSLLIGTIVGPGEATSVSRFNPAKSCWAFAIPPGASPGLYRFVIDGVSMKVDGRRLFRGPPLSLSAEFQILAG